MPDEAQKLRARTPQRARTLSRRNGSGASGALAGARRPAISSVSSTSPAGALGDRTSRGGQQRGRRGWQLLAGALLLVVAGSASLIHGRLTHRAAPQSGPPVDLAELRLEQAAAARPNDPSAWLGLGKLEESRARPFEAIWGYAEAQRLRPADPELPAHMASVLESGHMVDAAAAQLRADLRARPADLDARCRLAELYLTAADAQHARSVMEEQRPAVWRDATAVIVLGRARQACGDSAGAVGAFKRSLALQPQQAEAWYRLGRLYLALGRIDPARDGFLHAATADRTHPEYTCYAGETYLDRHGPGDLDLAINFFQMALAAKPNDTEADYEYGVALERLGRRDEALTRYSRAILDDLNAPGPNLALSRGFARIGDQADSRRYLGRYYDLTDRPAAAAREFHAMAAAAPKNVQPALLEGQIYIRTQDNARAVAVTEAALKQHPNDPQLLERLAVLKINRGDLPYARRLLHQWLTLMPQASRPLWLLGRCDLLDMKYADAVAWLQKAIAQQPFNGNYLAFLGGALLKMGTTESAKQAAAVLAKAVDREPDNAEYRDLYAQSLQRLGRYDEARRQYLQALDSDPYRVSLYAPLVDLAWRLHRPGVAAFFPPLIRAVQQRSSDEVSLWRRVWEHPDDANAHLKLARFLCRTGDLPKAGYQLEQAVQLRPDLPEARQLLATVRRSQEVM